jgi:hypothetical protein
MDMDFKLQDDFISDKLFFKMEVIFVDIQTTTSDPSKPVEGKLYFEIYYKNSVFLRALDPSNSSDQINVKNFPTNDPLTIQNLENKMYKSIQTEMFNFSQLLSPQPITVKVHNL